LVLSVAAELSPLPRVRFAALLHDLGKGRTPRSAWPRHVGHEAKGAVLVREVSARLRVPNEYRELAELAARWHCLAHRAAELRPRTLLELLESCDALRRPERFRELLLACEADYRGRGGLRARPYPQAELLRRAQESAQATTLSEADRAGLSGEEIGTLLRRRRLAALRTAT
jgi:tRNA nucleotidyltransferase (CCA-adding enzyme)